MLKTHLTITIISYFRSLCPGFHGKPVISVHSDKKKILWVFLCGFKLPFLSDSVLNYDLLISTPVLHTNTNVCLQLSTLQKPDTLLWLLLRTHKSLSLQLVIFNIFDNSPTVITLCEYPPFLDLHKSTTRQPSLSVSTVSKTLMLFNIIEVCIYCRKTENMKSKEHWCTVFPLLRSPELNPALGCFFAVVINLRARAIWRGKV